MSTTTSRCGTGCGPLPGRAAALFALVALALLAAAPLPALAQSTSTPGGAATPAPAPAAPPGVLVTPPSPNRPIIPLPRQRMPGADQGMPGCRGPVDKPLELIV